jgi:hypothetical protein
LAQVSNTTRYIGCSQHNLKHIVYLRSASRVTYLFSDHRLRVGVARYRILYMEGYGGSRTRKQNVAALFAFYTASGFTFVW